MTGYDDNCGTQHVERCHCTQKIVWWHRHAVMVARGKGFAYRRGKPRFRLCHKCRAAHFEIRRQVAPVVCVEGRTR